MEIYFKNTYPGVSKKLIDRTQKKVAQCSKLIDEGQFEAQAYIEIGRASGAHQTGSIWRTTINVDTRGERFHAESVQDTPEKATDRAVSELQNELRKYRARERTLRRQGNSIWKSFQRGYST